MQSWSKIYSVDESEKKKRISTQLAKRKEEEGAVIKNKNSFVDLMVALQNPEFNITKIMEQTDHNFQEFVDLYGTISHFPNSTTYERYRNFLQMSGIQEKIPESLDVKYLRRNGRSLIEIGKSAASIMNIKGFMDRTNYFSNKNNQDFFETIFSEDDIKKIKANLKSQSTESRKFPIRGLGVKDTIKFLANTILNPVLYFPLTFALQEPIRKIYDNEGPIFKRMKPEGYLKTDKFLDNKM